MLPGAQKDEQIINSEWRKLQQGIEGVVVKEVLHVPRDQWHHYRDHTRPEWDPTGLPVVQIYQSRLFPGAIGAWSCHTASVDRLFANQGHLKVVLFDSRKESGTYQQGDRDARRRRAPVVSCDPDRRTGMGCSLGSGLSDALVRLFQATCNARGTTTTIQITGGFRTTRRRSRIRGERTAPR